MSTFLQLLKETGIEPREAWKLRWIDVDVQRKTVAITPTKNHNARVLPISDNPLSRLLKLPRKKEKVFACKILYKFRWLYERARNQLSGKLENPRIHKIAFRSFRHWKATIEYHKTKVILHVKWSLGHKRIENTLIYTHFVDFRNEEYVVRVAKTPKEACQLVEAGFEYMTEMDSITLSEGGSSMAASPSKSVKRLTLLEREEEAHILMSSLWTLLVYFSSGE